MIYLPLVLPPVVTGYLLLIAFGRRGLFGEVLANIGIVFRLSLDRRGARLRRHGVSADGRRDPAVDRGGRPQVRGRRRDAGRQQAWTIATVTLPLALPGIIAGAVLAFARALGEFGATITFVSNIPGETQTISAAIYTLTQVPGGDAQAFKLVIVAVVISLVALIVSEWFGRRAGARVHGV